MRIKLEKYHAASDKDMSRAEAQLDVSFPQEYREFLLTYDGATPEENVFEDDVNVSVDRFIPVSELGKRASLIEGLPEDAVPIAEAPGGNFIYIRRSCCSVFYWDHEIESGDKQLSASFDDFLQKLSPFDIDSIQLKPGQVKSVWVDPDFKPEF